MLQLRCISRVLNFLKLRLVCTTIGFINCIEEQTGGTNTHLERLINYYSGQINHLRRRSIHTSLPNLSFPPCYPDDCRGIYSAMDTLKLAFDFDQKGNCLL